MQSIKTWNANRVVVHDRHVDMFEERMYSVVHGDSRLREIQVGRRPQAENQLRDTAEQDVAIRVTVTIFLDLESQY